MTDAEKLVQSHAGLLDCFRLTDNFAVAETIQMFCPDHSVLELINLGWIKPARNGRWTDGFAPGRALQRSMLDVGSCLCVPHADRCSMFDVPTSTL